MYTSLVLVKSSTLKSIFKNQTAKSMNGLLLPRSEVRIKLRICKTCIFP